MAAPHYSEVEGGKEAYDKTMRGVPIKIIHALEISRIKLVYGVYASEAPQISKSWSHDHDEVSVRSLAEFESTTSVVAGGQLQVPSTHIW